MMQAIVNSPTPASGFTAITLDASCTATASSSAAVTCSSMSVTAGDTIVVGCFTNNGSFDPSNIIASDPINGYYDGVQGNIHPAGGDDRVAVFVKENSNAGTITPQCWNWEGNGYGISGYAFKSTRLSQVLDGASAINLFQSATGTNPTAGSAGSPTNSNEAVVCMLQLASSTATTAGSGYSPAGTLTGVINTLAQYSQYQINPGSVNCNFGTGVSKAYTNTQIALLNASHSAGYKGLTGFYGAPAAAQTNGATATVAILNGASGSLSPLAANPASTGGRSLLAGSATTFDTSVAESCSGTLKLLVQGVPHTLGDAATSIKIPSGNTTTAYSWGQEGFQPNGTGVWLGSFMRMGSGATNGNFCDNWNLDANLAGGNFTTQVY